MDIRNYSYNKLAYPIFRWLGAKCKTLIFICLLATVLSTAVTCNDDSAIISSTVPFFPVQKAGLYRMNGEFEGKLVLDNGCLRVDKYLIIWPHGFSLRTEGEEIQVIDSNGQVVARVGDEIYVGGGEVAIPEEEAKELVEESIIGQPLPDNCTGPYWIVGETVKTVN